MSVANIICDASVLQPGREAWGWACAIITDRTRHYTSGQGRVPVASSNDAEFFAITNSLDFAFRRGMIAPNEVVLIQSDSLHAAGVFNYHFRSRHYRGAPVGRTCPTVSPAQAQAIVHLTGLLSRHPYRSIYVRHVKAHLAFANRAARNHVHERVDELAGIAARKAYGALAHVR